MRWRALTLFTVLVGLGVSGLLYASPLRFPWVVTVCLCFVGIVIFDSTWEILRHWANTLLFLVIYGLTLLSVLEASGASFWRDFSACVFLTALLYEQNSKPWSGLGWLRSVMPPAILFFLLVMVQSFSFLRAEATLLCAFAAILIFSFFECFTILRENSDAYSGSFMAATRAAVCGVGSLFYTVTFLPEAAKDYPFVLTRLLLPALGLVLAGVAGFFKQWRRRYILFCCNWSVFVFWAALIGEPRRFFASVAALVAGVWSIMMTHREGVDPSDTKDLYLKLSAWGIPGSLLFSLIVFVLLPSDNQFVAEGSVLWLITFFIYWSGLRKFGFSRKSDDGGTPWKWRHSLALALTVAGATLVAGGSALADFLSQFWGVGR